MPLMSFDNGNSLEARQFLLDRKSGRLHPKRHRTLKRRKALSAAKRARVKARLVQRDLERARYLAASAAYWAGTADGHP
jgi:hypothetical protein